MTRELNFVIFSKLIIQDEANLELVSSSALECQPYGGSKQVVTANNTPYGQNAALKILARHAAHGPRDLD
ncbi:protein of unknown function [Aminobacter niigataensis]|nr:protein of unknown function [Aminobacter niigataensis]